MLSLEELMIEVAFGSSISDLVKVVHVELNDLRVYLSDERGVVVVLEVPRQNLLGKGLFLENAKTFSVRCPTGNMPICLILRVKTQLPGEFKGSSEEMEV